MSKLFASGKQHIIWSPVSSTKITEVPMGRL